MMNGPDDIERRIDIDHVDTGQRRRIGDLPSMQDVATVIREATRLQRKMMRLTSLGWSALGVILTFAALGFLLKDDVARSSAIHDKLPDLAETLWSSGWLVSGVLMIIGTLRPWRLVEVLAHIILIGAMLPYATAIFSSFGPGFAFWIVIGLGMFSALRLYYLVRYAGRLRFIVSEFH